MNGRFRHRQDANGQNVIQRKTLIDGRDSWETVAAGDVDTSRIDKTHLLRTAPEQHVANAINRFGHVDVIERDVANTQSGLTCFTGSGEP